MALEFSLDLTALRGRFAGGEVVKGFLCESQAVERARDITSFGGWRASLQGGAGK